jgi:hypothetical protein
MADVYLRATLSPFTRDDPRYWELGRPADHTPAGLFVDGPDEAIPPTNKQAAPGRYHDVGKFTDATTAEPNEKRAADLQRRCAAGRARRLLGAIQRAA